MRGGRLQGRFMWLLEEMCRRCEVDTEFIDPTLTYYENKAEIEKEAHTRLFLKPDKRGPKVEMEEARDMVKSYECRDLEAEQMFDESVEILNNAISKS